jgi:ankyrin repeat protein
LAAASGHLDMLKLLLDNGTNVNGMYRGYTALAYAATAGYLDMVKLLLDSGAGAGEALIALRRANDGSHWNVAKLLGLSERIEKESGERWE